MRASVILKCKMSFSIWHPKVSPSNLAHTHAHAHTHSHTHTHQHTHTHSPTHTHTHTHTQVREKETHMCSMMLHVLCWYALLCRELLVWNISYKLPTSYKDRRESKGDQPLIADTKIVWALIQPCPLCISVSCHWRVTREQTSCISWELSFTVVAWDKLLQIPKRETHLMSKLFGMPRQWQSREK